MKKIHILLICLVLQSCNSQTKKKAVIEKYAPIAVPFDLSKLTLNEDINDIISVVNLSKKDTINSDYTTLVGNEKLVFDSDKVLVFDGKKLSGENSLGINNVIFHYGKIDKEIGPLNSEKEDIVGMYQINLFSENEIKYVIEKLTMSLGKVIFEKIDQGNVSNVVNNELIETSDRFKTKVVIWKQNDIVFYCFNNHLISKNKSECSFNLFVFNKNNSCWASFINTKGYPYTNEIYKNE